MNTIVVNLIAEPSCGKSTAAAYIFSKLKMNGINAEYVAEFAKDKVYEENVEVFKHQEYIFGKQSFKLARVNGKVDVIITDSPLLLSAIYNSDECLGESFNKTVINIFNNYNNVNFLLTRKHQYKNEGRIHNEGQAQKVREDIINKLNKYDIKYTQIDSTVEQYDKLIEDIIKKVEETSNEKKKSN